MMEDAREQQATSSSSGRWTAIGILAFAVLMVAAMGLYWELYTRPFRPLQIAIAEVFPDSSPRIIGGRHKSHRQDSPYTLRIVVVVPDEEFNPVTQKDRSEERARRIAEIVFDRHDVTPYDLLEIHLLQPVPESDPRQWSVSHSIEEWRAILHSAA